MSEISVARNAGSDEILSESVLEELASAMRGDLLRPDHADYDETRTVFNRMIDRRPALIARCTGTADVIVALTFARTNDLRFTVRGGGHNVAGHAVADDTFKSILPNGRHELWAEPHGQMWTMNHWLSGLRQQVG